MDVKKKKLYNFLVVPLLILASAFMRAVAVHSFIIPNNFAPGGVTGLSSILQYVTGWNAGIFLLIFNIPLVVIALIFAGKAFAIKTLCATILSSGLMLLMGRFNFYTFVGGERLLAALAAGILLGAPLAIMLRIGGSTGGTDVIAKIIQRKFKATNISWFVFALDSIVVVASFFVYRAGLEPVLLALAQMFVSSKTCETISQGLTTAIKYEIVTNHPDEISVEILNKLHRGVTKIAATGMYTGEEKFLLICIIRKRQVSDFLDIVKKYDRTFVYRMSAGEVLGQGFTPVNSD